MFTVFLWFSMYVSQWVRYQLVFLVLEHRKHLTCHRLGHGGERLKWVNLPKNTHFSGTVDAKSKEPKRVFLYIQTFWNSQYTIHLPIFETDCWLFLCTKILSCIENLGNVRVRLSPQRLDLQVGVCHIALGLKKDCHLGRLKNVGHNGSWNISKQKYKSCARLQPARRRKCHHFSPWCLYDNLACLRIEYSAKSKQLKHHEPVWNPDS